MHYDTLQIPSKNLNLCSEKNQKINEGVTGLQRHEGELLITDFSFQGELTL